MNGFWKQNFSEESGKWSFARFCTFIILLNELAWVWIILLRNNKPTLPELGGLTLFLLALYGANKVSTAATDIGTGTREQTKN